MFLALPLLVLFFLKGHATKKLKLIVLENFLNFSHNKRYLNVIKLVGEVSFINSQCSEDRAQCGAFGKGNVTACAK